MQPLWEQILEPVRQRARAASAPLLAKLGLDESDVEAIDWTKVDRTDPAIRLLARATHIAAFRGATRV